MANPQKENGFTPIANEILEKLVNISLLGSEFQVLLFVIRKTYGYHKKQDNISLTQFEKGTGLSRPTIIKAIKNLEIMKIIFKVQIGDTMGYTFIKDHDKWVIKTSKLVKGEWLASKDVYTRTSKDGFTATSKDVFTYKRKKDIKDIVAKRDTPKSPKEEKGVFNLQDEIKKLEESERRDFNVIALYLEHRKPDLQTHEQFNETLRRHLRPAKSLKVFNDEQILKALAYCKKEYSGIYTIETLLKVATK